MSFFYISTFISASNSRYLPLKFQEKQNKQAHYIPPTLSSEHQAHTVFLKCLTTGTHTDCGKLSRSASFGLAHSRSSHYDLLVHLVGQGVVRVRYGRQSVRQIPLSVFQRFQHLGVSVVVVCRAFKTSERNYMHHSKQTEISSKRSTEGVAIVLCLDVIRVAEETRFLPLEISPALIIVLEIVVAVELNGPHDGWVRDYSED